MQHNFFWKDHLFRTSGKRKYGFPCSDSGESWSTKMGTNWSSSSLLPSVANMYQRVNNSSSSRLLVVCFAAAPITIFVVFLRAHRFFFTALEPGKMILNSLAASSAIFKGRLYSSRKPKKNSSPFTTFWLKFAVAGLTLKLVNFLYYWATSAYPLYFEVSLCLLILISSSCATLNSLPHTVQCKVQYAVQYTVRQKVKPSTFTHSTAQSKTFNFLGFPNEFEFITPRII